MDKKEKVSVEATINGRVCVLSGYENVEFYEKQAAYLNDKIEMLKARPGFASLSVERQGLYIQLEIAEDLMKSYRKIEELEESVDEKVKTLYNIKHELIATKMKLEHAVEKKDKKDKKDE